MTPRTAAGRLWSLPMRPVLAKLKALAPTRVYEHRSRAKNTGRPDLEAGSEVRRQARKRWEIEGQSRRQCQPKLAPQQAHNLSIMQKLHMF